MNPLLTAFAGLLLAGALFGAVTFWPDIDFPWGNDPLPPTEICVFRALPIDPSDENATQRLVCECIEIEPRD